MAARADAGHGNQEALARADRDDVWLHTADADDRSVPCGATTYNTCLVQVEPAPEHAWRRGSPRPERSAAIRGSPRRELIVITAAGEVAGKPRAQLADGVDGSVVGPLVAEMLGHRRHERSPASPHPLVSPRITDHAALDDAPVPGAGSPKEPD